MNYLIELGIIVIAIGTFITYLGSKKENDKSQQIIIDKINSFSSELIKVQNDTVNDVDKALKIDELTNEFDSWAVNLKENYPEIKLAYNKKVLELSEKELKINREWRGLYIDIFKSIDNMIISINRRLDEGNKITITKNHRVPHSLFMNNEEDYYWIVTFDKNNFWKILLYRFEINQAELPLPSIRILYANNIGKLKDVLTWDDFNLRFNQDTVVCSAKGYFKFIDTQKFSKELKISNVNEILKTCFQYQLVKLDS